MTAGWVAASVRAKTLCMRRLGAEPVAAIARSPTLSVALQELSGGPYGRDLAPDLDLAGAKRSVDATLVWHLRILAGWCPPLGAQRVRVLAAGFEIRNVVEHLLRLQGVELLPPLQLGSLALAWPSVARSRSADAVRRALASSFWGDPGSVDPAEVGMALSLRWASEVRDSMPEAADWATSGAELLLDRIVSAGGEPRAALLSRWHRRGGRRQTEPKASGQDGWQREVAWWQGIEQDSARMVAGRVGGPTTVTGAVGSLAADRWRLRAALAVAAGGGGNLEEVLGRAVA